MKSKRITMYVCEECGLEYRNKEDCAEHEKTHNPNPMPELENLDILIFSNGKYGFYVDGNIIYTQDGNDSGYDYSENVKDRIIKIFRIYNYSNKKCVNLVLIRDCVRGMYKENIVWERKGK